MWIGCWGNGPDKELIQMPNKDVQTDVNGAEFSHIEYYFRSDKEPELSATSFSVAGENPDIWFD